MNCSVSGVQLLITQQCFYLFHRSGENSAPSSFDDRALHKIRMFDHQRDQHFVGMLALAQTQLAVDGFSRAQQITWLEFHLLKEFAQLIFAQRLFVIVDLLERDAALTEQPVSISTRRSSRFVVDDNYVRHGFCSSFFGLWPWALGLVLFKGQRPKAQGLFLRKYPPHTRRFRNALNGEDVCSCAHIRVVQIGCLVYRAKSCPHRLL
jgi:hypothetical protein